MSVSVFGVLDVSNFGRGHCQLNDAAGAAARAKQRLKQNELVRERETITQERNKIAAQLKVIEWRLVPVWRWHSVVGWKAEDYFNDPQVQSLCKAIENDDVKEMERLIAAGAGANSPGKDGMTPLLWAGGRRTRSPIGLRIRGRSTTGRRLC